MSIAALGTPVTGAGTYTQSTRAAHTSGAGRRRYQRLEVPK